MSCIDNGNCYLRIIQIHGIDDNSLNKNDNDMDILNFEAFLIAITILTLTPGLDTALVIRNTSRSGLADGCMTSFGICSGLYVHAFSLLWGSLRFLLNQLNFFKLLKW